MRLGKSPGGVLNREYCLPDHDGDKIISSSLSSTSWSDVGQSDDDSWHVMFNALLG